MSDSVLTMNASAASKSILRQINSPLMKQEWIDNDGAGWPQFDAIRNRGGWSSTEWTLIELAMAVWNGHTGARVLALLEMPDDLFVRVITILGAYKGITLIREA